MRLRSVRPPNGPQRIVTDLNCLRMVRSSDSTQSSPKTRRWTLTILPSLFFNMPPPPFMILEPRSASVCPCANEPCARIHDAMITAVEKNPGWFTQCFISSLHVWHSRLNLNSPVVPARTGMQRENKGDASLLEQLEMSCVPFVWPLFGQPTGNRLPTPAEQGADQQRQQPPRDPAIQHEGHLQDPRMQLRRQVPRGHPWLSCSMRFYKHRNRGRRATFFLCSLLQEAAQAKILSESAVCLPI